MGKLNKDMNNYFIGLIAVVIALGFAMQVASMNSSTTQATGANSTILVLNTSLNSTSKLYLTGITDVGMFSSDADTITIICNNSDTSDRSNTIYVNNSIGTNQEIGTMDCTKSAITTHAYDLKLSNGLNTFWIVSAANLLNDVNATSITYTRTTDNGIIDLLMGAGALLVIAIGIAYVLKMGTKRA
jgi:hypothetical protein